MSTAVVIQARTRSTRLPEKVLLPLAGAPLLQRMIERVQAAQSRSSFELMVATTVEPADEPIVDLCRRLGVRCFRGHPIDLLDRHLAAAQAVGAEVVVKIPSDCPLIDPEAIRLVLDRWRSSGGRLDYLGNLHPPTWPDGNDVEVMSIEALATAHHEARAPHEREHTTPFLWDHPERFRIGNVTWPGGRDLSMSHRFTIDYLADYLFLRAVYDALWSPARPDFSIEEILAFLDRNPEVRQLNAPYAGVNWYRHHLEALRTVPAGWTRQAPAFPGAAE